MLKHRKGTRVHVAARSGELIRLRICYTLVALALAGLNATAYAETPSALALARKALADGRYQDAEQRFQRMLSGVGRSKALVGLGRVALETGRYAEAERFAAEAAGDPQRLARAHTLRGEALSQQGKLDEAAQAYLQAIADPSALRARVLLGRLLLDRGQSAQAEPHLRAVIAAYNDDALGEDPAAALCYVAMAARALGNVHDANDTFREAALANRARVETQLEWASLFLEKNDLAHAAESAEEALAYNPHRAETRVLLARLALARSFDFGSAIDHLDKALAINPQLASAHVTRAAIALREMDIDTADRHLDRSLAINPHHLEALSVRAAARFLADDAAGFANAKREVQKRNPRFSRMYSIIAEYAEWEHRYEELVTMAREALAIDREDPLAHAALGMNLLRTGDEQGGIAALQQAWERDRFNVQVFNTLNLYENVIEKQYVDFSAPPFRIRLDKSERPVLEPYLTPMLRHAYEDMRKRYRFTPLGPLRIELYSNPQHFSVRTTGLPNVGVQGVCFGKVVTALSPRGGPFNWGQITWHELAHVFHLQLSKNHVPRWFTEGLAEYETVMARTEWRREEDAQLWSALAQGRVPKLRDFNQAFTHARTPEALMTAYYAAYRAVAYIVERFGFDKVHLMLEAWGRGVRAPEVFQQVLGTNIDVLDAEFRAHTRKRLSKYDDDFDIDFSRYADLDGLSSAALRAPEDPDAQAALALGLVARGRFAESAQAAQRALARVPQHPLANFALTRALLEKGDVAGAAARLRAILAGGKDGYILRLLLARAELATARYASARQHAEAAIALDAEQLEAWRILLQVAEKQQDQALGRRALSALAMLDQHDREAHLALMSLLYDARDFRELEQVGERALFLDPALPSVHRLLGEAYLHNDKAGQALTELDRALALGAPKPGHVQLARARAFLALGKRKEAQQAADQATKADPSLATDAAELLHR